MAGWNAGANMNPMPTSSMHRFTDSGLSSSLTPLASRISAAPTVPDAARLPCLATLTPTAAAVSADAVEMLKVPMPSPPVPTTSTRSPSVGTRNALARITLAMPVISSTDSPFIRSATRKAPICEGAASPVMISSATPAASSWVSVPPNVSFRNASWIIPGPPPPPAGQAEHRRSAPAARRRTSRARSRPPRPTPPSRRSATRSVCRLRPSRHPR